MLECTAELDKVLPHGSLGDEPPLFLKVLQKSSSNAHTQTFRERERGGGKKGSVSTERKAFAAV